MNGCGVKMVFSVRSGFRFRIDRFLCMACARTDEDVCRVHVNCFVFEERSPSEARRGGDGRGIAQGKSVFVRFRRRFFRLFGGNGFVFGVFRILFGGEFLDGPSEEIVAVAVF